MFNPQSLTKDEENDIDAIDLPIYKNGREIHNLVRKIGGLIPDDDETSLIAGVSLIPLVLPKIQVVFSVTHRLMV